MDKLTLSQFKSLYASYVKAYGDHYESGQLPMTDEEVRIIRRNHNLEKKVFAPLLILVGLGALAGAIYSMSISNWVAGTGLILSSVSCVAFGVSYFFGTSPEEHPHKYYVTGIITDKRRRVSGLTNVYYYLVLNDSEKWYVTRRDFDVIQHGDIVRCERVSKHTADAHSVLKLGSIQREGKR